MTTQLVLKDMQPNRRLLKKVPVSYYVDQFKNMFKSAGVGLNDEINSFFVANMLGAMGEKLDLKHDMFIHELESDLDEFNDFIKINYNIKILNAIVKINLIDEVFDPYKIHLTPKNFIKYFINLMEQANESINKFNKIAANEKPKFPMLPVEPIVDRLVEETEGTNGLGVSETLARVKRIPLTKDKAVVVDFNVFYSPAESWSEIDSILKVRNVGIGFLLDSREVTYYNELSPQFYRDMIVSMNQAIKNWNFIVDGGVKESKVRNTDKMRMVR